MDSEGLLKRMMHILNSSFRGLLEDFSQATFPWEHLPLKYELG